MKNEVYLALHFITQVTDQSPLKGLITVASASLVDKRDKLYRHHGHRKRQHFMIYHSTRWF